MALCRSCFHSGRKKEEGVVTGSFIVGGPQIRFEIEGWEVARLREAAGVGLVAFADKMGWSKGYQCQIEKGGRRTLSLEITVKMIDIFQGLGIEIIDAV